MDGEIDDFLLSGKSAARVGDTLYFYVTVRRGDGHANVLYAIDLANNTLRSVLEDHSAQVLITLYPYDGKLLSLKSTHKSDADFVTYFDVYDAAAGSSTVAYEASFDRHAMRGIVLVGYTSAQGDIYALCEEDPQGDLVLGSNINVYDQRFNVKKTIDIANIKDYIFSSGIWEMWAMGESIYIYNYANDAMFGRIASDKIEPMIRKRAWNWR